MPLPTWITKTFVAGNVLQAADLNQFRDDFIIQDQHEHSGVAGHGGAVLVAGSAQGVTERVTLWMRFPKSTTGFTWATDIGAISAVQNDEIVFPVGLRSGTYKLDVGTEVDTNKGIGTVYLDAVSKGTIDFYQGSTGNIVKSLTGITVATAGWYDLKIKMETKNASSSGYIAILKIAVLTRTGA